MRNLGVIIVTYNAEDVIRDCLETLCAAAPEIKIVVIDNASTDNTVQIISGWANGVDGYSPPTDLPFDVSPRPKPVTNLKVVTNSVNGGFAAGVNIGLRHLQEHPEIERFWILNPDTLTPAGTPEALASAPDGFSLMGHRILYADPPHQVQTDGGTINRWTGVTGNLNLGAGSDISIASATDAAFISGASMVASKKFVTQAGPMPEDYFLYYEEVDWAQARGTLPLKICKEARVFHRAGTAIGSPTLTQTASAFSSFYKYRARMKYQRKHNPNFLPVTYLYAWAKALQFIAKGHRQQAMAVLKGIHGLPLSTNKVAQTRHQTIKRRA